MMIPITRKEKYINEIVGGGNTAPETPQTREELFFADILGEVVAPSPITRAEKYLAKIANKYSGELPEPVTRIERFLAMAAGMDISIPTPVTREEMFWVDYALIVEKELSGIPPLTFNAIAGTLKNYRIYGNTVDGESVGNRTRNLFDGIVTNEIIQKDGSTSSNNNWRCSDFIRSDSASITLSWESNNGYFQAKAAYYSSDKTFISSEDVGKNNTFQKSFVLPSGASVIRLAYSVTVNGSPANRENIMLNSGSTALPYEPYGYRVPVTVNDIITNIYLDEPLAKSGNNADYIDYETQKRHNSGGTESSVTLPEIIITAGTNTLTVGTEVQPSEVYIKYEGAR